MKIFFVFVLNVSDKSVFEFVNTKVPLSFNASFFTVTFIMVHSFNFSFVLLQKNHNFF